MIAFRWSVRLEKYNSSSWLPGWGEIVEYVPWCLQAATEQFYKENNQEIYSILVSSQIKEWGQIVEYGPWGLKARIEQFYEESYKENDRIPMSSQIREI